MLSNQIYYTHPDYYCAEPFPEEWISMVQEKAEANESIQRNRTKLSQMGLSPERYRDFKSKKSMIEKKKQVN